MRRRPVMLANIAGTALGFGMFANFFVTISILQLSDVVSHGFGTSILVAGVVLLPGAIATVAMSPLSARITDLRGGRTTLFLGSLIVGAGFVTRPFLLGSLLAVAIGVTLVNCGVGIAYGAIPTVVMANVPLSETASANAVNALGRAGGAAIGSSVVAGVLGSLTVVVGGTAYPSLFAFQLLFVLCGMCAFGAAFLAYLLPRQRPG